MRTLSTWTAICTLKATLLCLLVSLSAPAQPPQLLNYQGRVQIGANDFTGTGQFKFALVNGEGSESFWSNDGTSIAGSEPTASVALPVGRGLYSVLLGDTSLANMTPIPASVFTNSNVRLRVWFNDGTTGLQQLSPDQRIASVGYSLMAANVADGAVTSPKLALGAVTGTAIASGAVTSAKLGSGSVTTDKLAGGSVTSEKLGDISGALQSFGLNAKPLAIKSTVTMTVTNSGVASITENVIIIDSPQLELVTGYSVVSPLTVRRPVKADPGWQIWVSDLIKQQNFRRNVRLDFPGDITIILEDAFPVEYYVEPGTDGNFYETLSIKPNRYTR